MNILKMTLIVLPHCWIVAYSNSSWHILADRETGPGLEMRPGFGAESIVDQPPGIWLGPKVGGGRAVRASVIRASFCIDIQFNSISRKIKTPVRRLMKNACDKIVDRGKSKGPNRGGQHVAARPLQSNMGEEDAEGSALN